MELYFIALVPQGSLRDEIRVIKERMLLLYGAGHAIKSPAHITLQKPFKRSIMDESVIFDALGKFAGKENSFNIKLSGFGCFPPRVIFVRVTEYEPVISLHGRLKKMLTDELGFSPEGIMSSVQPHITIATRDLTKEAFREAWSVLQHEAFSGLFDVQSLFLLKHNGKSWDILKEFPFRNDE